MLNAGTVYLLALSAGVLTVCLAATYLVVVAVKTLRAARKTAQLKAGRAVLFKIMGGGWLDDADVNAMARLPATVNLQMFNEFASVVSGVQTMGLRELAVRLGMVASMESSCRSRLWWRRLAGVRFFIQAGSSSAVVEPLMADRNPWVRAEALTWAGAHPTPARVKILLDTITNNDRFCRHVAQDSLVRCGGLGAEALSQRIDEAHEQTLPFLLVVAESIGDPAFLGQAIVLSQRFSPQVRLSAAKVLAAIGGETANARLIEMLNDESAAVKAEVCRSLATIKLWQAASGMVNLLSDRDWDVQKAAAEGLAELGPPGQLVLRHAVSEQLTGRELAQWALDSLSVNTVTQGA